jgi:hypothetical protein
LGFYVINLTPRPGPGGNCNPADLLAG